MVEICICKCSPLADSNESKFLQVTDNFINPDRKLCILKHGGFASPIKTKKEESNIRLSLFLY